MNIISLTGVTKTLADTPLFEDVTLGIDAGERIGFVGRNGCGKSTFLKVLQGELEPDRGSVARNRALKISTAEQRPVFAPATTLDEFLFQDREGLKGAEEEAAAAVVNRYRSYCRELGMRDPAARMGTFSGGMIRKAVLARCLAFGAGFVTLDEPTNHLDIDTIEWLESLLRGAAFGFLVVTHDRRFLDAVCTSIMEIESRSVLKYAGNYSDYVARKAERAELQDRTEQRRNSVLRGELEWLKRGPRARTGKDKSRKSRIQDLRDAGVQKEISLQQFSSSHRRLGTKVLELQGISKSYGGAAVIRPFSYSFRRGERIGVIGPNGSGKTTFLNLLVGRVDPDGGSAVKGETTSFAYFEQTAAALDLSVTVLGFITGHAERIGLADGTTVSAEQFLERFLFPRDMHKLTLGRLSGGELRRLVLARMLAEAPNFLLLDEPTNDLDLDTIRLLEQYLQDFSGCILLVSHDRALLDRLTDYLFVFDGAGGIRGFTGTYDEYRELQAEDADPVGSAASRSSPAPRPAAPRRAPREGKAGLTFKERREYEGLPDEIAALEAEHRELERGFQEVVGDPMERARNHKRYEELTRLIEAGLARWEELAARAGE
jgi:ABC transport system ATP-binding/permease protein